MDLFNLFRVLKKKIKDYFFRKLDTFQPNLLPMLTGWITGWISIPMWVAIMSKFETFENEGALLVSRSCNIPLSLQNLIFSSKWCSYVILNLFISNILKLNISDYYKKKRKKGTLVAQSECKLFKVLVCFLPSWLPQNDNKTKEDDE